MRLTQAVMLPLQSPDGLTPHLPAGTQGVPGVPTAPTVPFSAAEGGMDRLQKPKTLPCKYCNKRFRLVAALIALLSSPPANSRSPGESSMSRDTRGRTRRRSRSSASGTGVGRHLVDGKSCAPNRILPSVLRGPSLAELHWLLTGRVSPTPKKNCQCNRPVFSYSSIRHSAYIHVPLPNHNLAAHSGYACFSHPYPTTSLLPSLLSPVPLPTQISTTCQGQGHLSS